MMEKIGRNPVIRNRAAKFEKKKRDQRLTGCKRRTLKGVLAKPCARAKREKKSRGAEKEGSTRENP